MKDICQHCDDVIFVADGTLQAHDEVIWSHLNDTVRCADPTPRFTMADLEIISVALEEWEMTTEEFQRDLSDEQLAETNSKLENVTAIRALNIRVSQLMEDMTNA